MDTIGKGELEAARYDRCAVFGRVMVVESEYDNQVQVARDHLLVFAGGVAGTLFLPSDDNIHMIG